MGLSDSIGHVLRQARQQAGLTQENLAFRACLHRTYVSMLERGVKSPTVEVLSRLAAALGTSGSAILHKAETRARATGRGAGRARRVSGGPGA